MPKTLYCARTATVWLLQRWLNSRTKQKRERVYGSSLFGCVLLESEVGIEGEDFLCFIRRMACCWHGLEAVVQRLTEAQTARRANSPVERIGDVANGDTMGWVGPPERATKS